MGKRIAHHKSLRDFVEKLESQEELLRIAEPVSPELEITEITDRTCKSHGPALLFEEVKGSDFPVLTNAFGSYKRMALALGVGDIEDIADEIESILQIPEKSGFGNKAKALFDLMKLGSYAPRTVKTGPCKDVIIKDPDLGILPVLKCWPGDAGRFITLPIVVTRDPESGMRNLGMYRMQVYDRTTAGLHWHVHKVGAAHYRKYEQKGERMPVAVALGGDPAVTYAATAPLPETVDELLFAGFLRQKGVDLVKCETNDLEVPAESDFVIEGYVEPGERRTEGPFGDHTGYYSPADDYPVFHVTCLAHRKDAIYPATVVGRPPMEDCYMAKATERIFLPLMRLLLPEIVDINLPVEGVFHNLAIVSIRKRFPFHARKVMNALWGMGQLMFTKVIIILDEGVNIQDPSEVVWRAANNTDPKRDIMFVEGPVDVLNPAVDHTGFGSKMGIDATKKWKEEGFSAEWPQDIAMSDGIKARVDNLMASFGIKPPAPRS